MGFKNNTYAKFWGPLEYSQTGTPSGRISISSKNKQTDQYEQMFSAYVRFVGGAKEKAKALKEGDRIHLLEVDLINRYNKDTKQTSWYPLVYNFELADRQDGASAPAQQTAQTKAAPATRAPQSAPSPTDDDGLPF